MDGRTKDPSSGKDRDLSSLGFIPNSRRFEVIFTYLRVA